jgi:hypothetical protein
MKKKQYPQPTSFFLFLELSYSAMNRPEKYKLDDE